MTLMVTGKDTPHQYNLLTSNSYRQGKSTSVQPKNNIESYWQGISSTSVQPNNGSNTLGITPKYNKTHKLQT